MYSHYRLDVICLLVAVSVKRWGLPTSRILRYYTIHNTVFPSNSSEPLKYMVLMRTLAAISLHVVTGSLDKSDFN